MGSSFSCAPKRSGVDLHGTPDKDDYWNPGLSLGTIEESVVSDNGASKPEESIFSVRGAKYLSDGVKVPVEDATHLELIATDLLINEEAPCSHISEDPRSFVARHPNYAPWLFVVHIITPGPPWLSLGLYFVPSGGRTLTQLLAEETPGTRLLRKCLQGDLEEWRRFKLITHLIEAPMALWATLGSVPIVAGKHCHRSMHRTALYHEIIMDMGSSTIGRAFYSVFQSQTEWCIIDCAVLLEGLDEDELPEELLAVVHVHRIHAELAQGPLGRCSEESCPEVDASEGSILGPYLPSWSPGMPSFAAPTMPAIPHFELSTPAMPELPDMDCATGREPSSEYISDRARPQNNNDAVPRQRPQPRPQPQLRRGAGNGCG